MAYDSAATRAPLLDAAYAEFSERGLAGARVERIAAVAWANKQAIYAYFGSKAGLFDAVIAARLGLLSDTVPFTPDDLPGYAGRSSTLSPTALNWCG
jgi:AcrR family transcriptional regulator